MFTNLAILGAPHCTTQLFRWMEEILRLPPSPRRQRRQLRHVMSTASVLAMSTASLKHRISSLGLGPECYLLEKMPDEENMSDRMSDRMSECQIRSQWIYVRRKFRRMSDRMTVWSSDTRVSWRGSPEQSHVFYDDDQIWWNITKWPMIVSGTYTYVYYKKK